MSSDDFATWTVTHSPGRVTYVVNGEDITAQVLRGAIVLDPVRIPTLQLELKGGGLLEGVGIVQVLLDDDQAEVPITQAVLRFLDSIDPTDLEQKALAGGMLDGIGQAMLTALREQAIQ